MTKATRKRVVPDTVRDLRQEFLEAALQVLTSNGSEVLSFRELARQLGVSTAAPYHHFRDRSELLLILAVEGFSRLIARFIIAEARETTIRGSIAALTQAYLQFAREESGYYRAMFLPDIIRPEYFSDLEGPAAQCFDLVCKVIARANEKLAPDVVSQRAVMTWSLLHGMLILSSAGPLGRRLPSDLEDQVAIDAVTSLVYAR